MEIDTGSTLSIMSWSTLKALLPKLQKNQLSRQKIRLLDYQGNRVPVEGVGTFRVTYEPPVGMLTRKMLDDNLETLICQAFGFYPKEIQVNWTRDGEVCKYETLQRNVAPNSDGTYYVWTSIEIDPKERDRFQCHLEHEGLQEPLVLAWKEDTVWWILVWMVATMILACGILFLSCWWWRCRKKHHPEEALITFLQNCFLLLRRWDSVVGDAPS